MELENQNILFFTRTMNLGGTENVVLQLCEIFRPLVNNIVVCSCGGVNVDKLSSIGIKHYYIPDIENRNPYDILKTACNIRHIVKQEKISVIHTHHRMAAFYISIMQLYKQCKFINTCHNTFGNKKILTQIAYNHGNLIACGEMVKRNLEEYFNLPDERVTVIHNAVQPFDEKIVIDDFIKELHKQGNFIVGNIGRLSDQKGMEYYIKAIPSIIEEHPRTRFIIVGTGEKEQYLKNLSETLRISQYLYFLGYRNDIQNLISQLDLLVLSSLWEGLPLTPIEAFSVGKTIVATNVDGTVEIVRDGIDGFLVPPKDSNAIVEKVSYLINRPTIRKKCEYNAIARYRDEFSFDKLSRSYIEYYKQL